MTNELAEAMRTIADEVEVDLAISAGKTFDFTPPVETFDSETFNVYSRLRRAARLFGGEMPGGKVYTESQVIDILGEDYERGLVIDPKCCP